MESRRRFHDEGDRTARRCKLDRVAEDIDHNLPQLHVVADIIIVDRAFHPAFILKALVPALFAYDRIDLGQRILKRELLVFHDDTAGLNTAHVKNVVDDAEQMLGRQPDLLNMLSCSFRDAGIIQHDAVQPDDCIHRRADFMAHIRQERRLCLVGLIGLFQRDTQ